MILAGDLNDFGRMDGFSSSQVDTPSNGHYREADDNDPAHCPGYGEGTVEADTTGGPARST
ncbi:hypothetical protein [Nonomuraea sediminis]|uniref:hypothetical protein n=1 Tax=Nonomuraea sediminis TaxID=2835864 RepID=UPI001BDD4745|nr:hypothetical protein [Nonomuraea sediminis]